MPNFVSTSTPAASGPAAMNLLALKQRMAQQQAQQAAISRPHTVTSPWQGLGDLANSFFTARQGDYLQQQDAATRDTLAKMRAGWDPAGPTPAQAAAYSQLDPEEGNRVADQVMQAKQAAATADTLFGHQQTLQTQAEGSTAGLQSERLKQEKELTLSGRQHFGDPMTPEQAAAAGVTPGTQIELGTNRITPPEYGAGGGPLSGPTGAAVAGAQDFLANADNLKKAVNTGKITSWKSTIWSGILGLKGESSSVRDTIEQGADQLKALLPASEAERIDRTYVITPSMGPTEVNDMIDKLSGELKSAKSGHVAGRAGAALPGGNAGGGSTAGGGGGGGGDNEIHYDAQGNIIP